MVQYAPPKATVLEAASATQKRSQMVQQFNSKKAASEWTKLVDDLLAAAASGGNQSTSIEALQQRFAKIQVAINVAPSRVMNNSLKDLGRSLDRRFDAITPKGNSKEGLVDRKAMRDELKKMERAILQNAMTNQTTMGRQLLKNAEMTDRRNRKEFIRNARANETELRKTLSKQLLEVSEQRGISDSAGLASLERDLKASIRSLQSGDYDQYRSLSKQVADVQKNYGLGDDTAERLSDIQDLVRDNLERTRNRNAKIGDFAEKAFGLVGAGGLIRGGRKVARGVGATYRTARYAKMGVSRGIASAVRTSKKGLTAVGNSLRKSGSSDAKDQQESSLFSRQVRALEALVNKKGSGSNSVTSGPGMLGGIGKTITDALARYAPAALAVAFAGVAGYEIGKLLNSYVINPLISKLMGRDASLGTAIYDLFHDDPGEKEKKAAEAKRTGNYNRQMSAGATLRTQGTPISGGRGSMSSGKGWSSGGKVVDTKTYPMNNYSNEGRNYAQKPSIGGAISSGFRTMAEAAGKLFQVKPGVDIENIDPSMQSNFLAMITEYNARGGKSPISINSGFRSLAKQAELYAKDPTKAAPPGFSNHGRGLALDIDRAGANELGKMGLLSKYGFTRPVSGEPWHLVGKGGTISAKGMAATMGTSVAGTATASSPVTIPPSSGSTSSQAAAAPTSAPNAAPTVVGSNQKGSVDNIPTFSYRDQGFFMMNAGVIGS